MNSPSITAPVEPTSGQTIQLERISYLDHLRVLLTVLVVLHHVAVIYGDIPLFYYTEPAKDSSGRLLDYFLLFNQTFFMGFFFLIAGYFCPGSYDHKGARAYMMGRLVRLGIPLLAFLLVLRPILVASIYPAARATAAEHGTHLTYWLFYLITWDPGPLWFVEVLLIFSWIYVLFRRKFSRRVPQRPSGQNPSLGGVLVIAALIYALLLAVVSYLWREIVPIGQYWPLVGLPTPAFLPQYASLFVIGIASYRHGWLGALPRWAGVFGLVQATVAAGLLYCLLQQKTVAGGPAWMGHGTWQSIEFALCESLLAVGIIIALLVIFRECFNGDGPFGRFLSRQSYAVYVIHPLVLVALGHAFASLHAIAVVKFLLVALIAIPLSWASASLVRRLPFAGRIL